MSYGQRMVSPTLLEEDQACQIEVPKWPLFRELCVARKAFGLSDRDLTVLNALLSFHKGSVLKSGEQLVVFPSNRTLSLRANGMPESTLRRHLAALVSAGVIRRQDSPNRKRYARKTHQGVVALAFGFDLSPLRDHAKEIEALAEKMRMEAAELKLLRDQVLLLKRDAIELISCSMDAPDRKENWDDLQETLLALHKKSRRKLDSHALQNLKENLLDLHREIAARLPTESENMSGRVNQNERHCQSSDKEDIPEKAATAEPLRVPLKMAILGTPEMQIYTDTEIRSWSDYHKTASVVRGMMGITTDVWHEAENSMGTGQASVVVGCILQRMNDIKNPDGYLKSLTLKSKNGLFSPLPMLVALLNKMDPLTKVDSCQLRLG